MTHRLQLDGGRWTFFMMALRSLLMVLAPARFTMVIGYEVK